ncbi:hypothetical protein J4G48_0031660 [Bradyrhizobium barranii subsp. apii]|uniref:MarR family transcriptional regulator n=1 Tax=Bradyrhizobium barranii TaxID=2992140 RepID=UPI001AA138F6|nr:MarR family transcriptional regulator [Bradyrhizobium barranii]UPT93869.1 hypothetical protein J4G48_0031660 [Bradyrhizobium barranii subsp. apii]
MNDPKQRTAKPGDLLSQWWTLGAIAADRRTTGRHMKAGWVIINSYWQKHGNGRASLRYIQRATGLGRPAIGKACRELAEWGHVTRVPGIGTRPSEYVPRWVTMASGVQTATTSDDAPSGAEMQTTLVSESTPLEGASGVEMDTESYLPEPAYRPASGRVDDDCAAPTAPPLAGLAPATAGTAQEELPSAQAKPTFEALWRAYNHAKGKKEARDAWNALPAEVDRAAVIRAAAAWQAAWAAQGKPDAPRFTLARWLRDERYDEDAPKGFQKVEKANKPAKQATATKPKLASRTTVRVTSADVVTIGGVTELRILGTDAEGHAHERIIDLEHPDMETQFAGQRLFAQLVHAAGLEQIADGEELLGRTVVITEDGFTAPTTRPDGHCLCRTTRQWSTSASCCGSIENSFENAEQ